MKFDLRPKRGVSRIPHDIIRLWTKYCVNKNLSVEIHPLTYSLLVDCMLIALAW